MGRAAWLLATAHLALQLAHLEGPQEALLPPQLLSLAAQLLRSRAHG